MSKASAFPGPQPNPATEKAVYSRAARKRLTRSRQKLDGVTTVIRKALAVGRLPPGPQLDRRLAAAEKTFDVVEAQLRLLQKSGPGDWQEERIGLESAWEELARTISILAAHFSDGIDREKHQP